MDCICWEPSDELQESLGPSGPEIQKESETKSPGASGPWVPKKSGKSLEKSPKSLEMVSKMAVRDFFETSSRLLGPPGLFLDFEPGGPERLL